MMRIAERVAVEYGCGALITGESLGQVASQTMPAMAVTGAVCGLPVFRPCIGMDKEEIVTIARKIDTFETSILPYEDCCTVFTPKHPNTCLLYTSLSNRCLQLTYKAAGSILILGDKGDKYESYGDCEKSGRCV